MKIANPACRRAVRLSVSGIRTCLTGLILVGTVFVSGCGESPETEPVASEPSQPAASPTKPSAVVQPPGEAGDKRVVYVVNEFQAMNADGTYTVPVGAEVTVIEEEGDEFQIEYEGIRVRTPKVFFADQPPASTPATTDPTDLARPTDPTALTSPTDLANPTALTSPTDLAKPIDLANPAALTNPAEPGAPAPLAGEPATPTMMEPTPEATPEPMTNPSAWQPDPNATPDPTLSADSEKSSELLDEIRDLNEQIRDASDQKALSSSDDANVDDTKIRQLKKRRDQLSEDLTDVAKP